MPSPALIAAEGMSSAAVDRVPTLTEVVDEWSVEDFRPGRVLSAPVLVSTAPVSAPVPTPVPEMAPVQASQLSADLLFELEGRVALALEARLREALAPVLARAADAMIRDAKQELSALMRELMEDAVTRAIERHTNL